MRRVLGIALATGIVATGAGATAYVVISDDDNSSAASTYSATDSSGLDSTGPDFTTPPTALPSAGGPTPSVLVPTPTGTSPTATSTPADATTTPGNEPGAEGPTEERATGAHDGGAAPRGNAGSRDDADPGPVPGRPGSRTPVPPKNPTSPLGSADLRVGSYNVLSVSLDKTAGEQRPWRQRRDGVIRNILGESVDVIGLQEVNASSAFADRVVQGQTQLEDVTLGLNAGGGSYAATDTIPTTSGADRILYDTRTVSLVAPGSYDFAAQDPSSVTRGFAYATLQTKSTGKKFFFVSTHLEASSSSVRQRQWSELIPKVKSLAGSLPVIAVGDFNVQKMDTVACTYLPAMKAAGFGDTLNQECLTNPTRDVRAERLVNGWINSLNHMDRSIAPHAYEDSKNKTGNSIDYIFATNSLRVKEWKVVLNYDPSTLRFLGVLPSDHNMIRATISLP